MDDTLNELYQEIILEHNRHPRNKRPLEHPTCCAQGYNPSCGDNISVFISVKDDAIQDITFDGEGCAISQASASLMTEYLHGKTVEEARRIVQEICDVLSNKQPENNLDAYGEIAALTGVKQFPMRIKCATLAWHALQDALNGL